MGYQRKEEKAQKFRIAFSATLSNTLVNPEHGVCSFPKAEHEPG
jgi:hypothetical protein